MHHRLVQRTIACAALLATAGLNATSALAQAASRARGFNTDFLQGAAANADLNAFLAGEGIIPGSYRLDVIVNRVPLGRENVVFERDAASGKVRPCLGLATLQLHGVDTERLRREAAAAGLDLQARCLDLNAVIPEYAFDYQPSRLQLRLSYPQAWMRRDAARQHNPAQWDEGVNVAFSNYSASTIYTQPRNGDSSQSTFIGLRNGINLGRWRFRNDANLNSSPGSGTRFRSNRTYVQRDIDALNSQLTLGQTFTDSQIFDSVRIRGVELRMDESMLPDNQRGYAPSIRGIAESNATVEVRQAGYLLLSVPVSPGPFVIDDLYPSGSNGELEITIIEADGRRRVTRQPFGALPVMVRAGALRYTAAFGRYDSYYGETDEVPLATGTLTYGVNDQLTVYGGLQAAAGFKAANLGLGFNSEFGAVSGDLTQSFSDVRGARRSGQSLRMLYSKTFTRTDTNFTVAGYRYSSVGYRTLQTHINEISANGVRDDIGRARASFNASVYQSLGPTFGSVYVSASTDSYWNIAGSRRSLQTGYSNSLGRVNYNLSLTYTNDMLVRDRQQPLARGDETRFMITLSAPLGAGAYPVNGSASVTGGSGPLSVSSGVSGMVPGQEDMSYALNAGRFGEQTSASASLSTRLRHISASGVVSQGSGYRSTMLNASGAAVLHGGGLNFSSSLGETFGLVHVPGVRDVRLQAGGQTDANGYGIVPYLQPYARNTVSIDGSTAGAAVELEQTSNHAVPRRGAAAMLSYKAETGRRIQFSITTSEGTSIPLGASVEDAQGAQIGVTDTKGRVMLFLTQDTGQIRLRWERQVCLAAYQLPPPDAAKSFQRVALVCDLQSSGRMRAQTGAPRVQ